MAATVDGARRAGLIISETADLDGFSPIFWFNNEEWSE